MYHSLQNEFTNTYVVIIAHITVGTLSLLVSFTHVTTDHLVHGHSVSLHIQGVCGGEGGGGLTWQCWQHLNVLLVQVGKDLLRCRWMEQMQQKYKNSCTNTQTYVHIYTSTRKGAPTLTMLMCMSGR